MDRRTLLGLAGTVGTTLVAGCTGDGGESEPTDTASETPSPEPTPTEGSPVDQTVDVGPGGSLRFEPESFQIGAGDTVRWVFQSADHNVKVEAAPDGADWSGTPGGEFDTLDAGETHEHTFTAPGAYDYVCAPHRSAGMVASFTVEE